MSVFNCQMQRSAPRRNHLNVLKENTVETGRNNEADDTEKICEKVEEEQDIQGDSKKKASMFYPLNYQDYCY